MTTIRCVLSTLLCLVSFLTVQAQNNKSIVTYFSWGGNTEKLALEIARLAGADVYKIEPETPYTTDYNTLAYDVAN